MSRISREDVWNYTFESSRTDICPCCLKTKLHYSCSSGDNGWVRGHIIPARLKCPDIIENIRPICIECNKNDKSYDSNYHYMVSIGTMSVQTCNEKLKEIEVQINKVIADPSITVCVGFTVDGTSCKYQKKPRSLFCKKCLKYERTNYHYYTMYSNYETLVIYKNLIKYNIDFDDDEITNMRSTIARLEHEIRICKMKLEVIQYQQFSYIQI